jgi:peptidoglycan/xylan/chitin deacetylase (PgdA/CDA1 family)
MMRELQEHRRSSGAGKQRCPYSWLSPTRSTPNFAAATPPDSNGISNRWQCISKSDAHHPWWAEVEWISGAAIEISAKELVSDLMLRPPLILGYHGITRLEGRLDPEQLVVDPERFLRQVRQLQRRGYSFLKVSEFVGQLRGHQPPPQLAVLTFDDGTEDQATLLPELLEQLDVPATVYVCPSLLGQPNPFLSPDSGHRLMTVDELATLAANPRVEIGSHTRTHVVLREATEEEAYQEMSSSKTELEALIAQPVLTFAYPECFYSPACPSAAARAGYVAAVTCGPRGGWQPYELARQPVSALDGRLAFELKSRALWYPLRESRAGRWMRWTGEFRKYRARKRR